jgi:LAS superfamily LD-carboxypeptidase LdcB
MYVSTSMRIGPLPWRVGGARPRTVCSECARDFGEEVAGLGVNGQLRRWINGPDQRLFLERVLRAHISSRQGPRLRDLTDAELKAVPGTAIRMETEAAAAAGRLLAAANRDLAAAKAEGDVDALRTIRITANSGYRGQGYQEGLWRKYFTRAKDGYYNRTLTSRSRLPGGEHGDAAVRWMTRYVSPKIAAPGFSKHQAGRAIDFRQVRTRGHQIANSTNPRAVERWRNTWFFGWLQRHAGSCGFDEYRAEPWHWTYRG